MKTEKRNQTNRPSSKNEPNQDLRGCTPKTLRPRHNAEKVGCKGVDKKIVIYWLFENKNRKKESKMLTTKEKNRFKKMVEGNKTFHYSYVDRLRQDVRYYVNQCESAVKARESMEILEFIYSLFSDKELPTWYTKANLENDKKSIEKLERWAA